MADPVGKQATHFFGLEPSYGAPPTAGTPLWLPLTMYSVALGKNSGFEADPILGRAEYNNRDPGVSAPTLPDTSGSEVAPMCLREMGWWLTMLLGAPDTTEDGGVFTHVFESGKDALPSFYRQQRLAAADWRRVPGVMLNTLGVTASKTSGYARMNLGLIGKDEILASAALAGTLLAPYTQQSLANTKFIAKWGGAVIGPALTVNLDFSNNMTPSPAMTGTDAIESVDMGEFSINGTLELRYRDQTWAAIAAAETEAAFALEAAIGPTAKVTFELGATRLRQQGQAISGPGVYSSSFALSCRQTATDPALRVTLINDIESYAAIA